MFLQIQWKTDLASATQPISSIFIATNHLKKATFKYEQEGRFCVGVAKVESKEYWTITGKRCPVFDYTDKKIFTIDAYKKRNLE